MANQQFSPGRFAVLAVVASPIVFGLLAFWMLSAQFPWSSDDWLMAIPLAIMLMGVVAAIVLVGVFAFRLWKRQK